MVIIKNSVAMRLNVLADVNYLSWGQLRLEINVVDGLVRKHLYLINKL